MILRELELIWLISSLLSKSLFVWNGNIRHLLEISFDLHLRVFGMGVLEGVTHTQVETPCLGVRNTRSGVRARKVSRRLVDQASDVHLYSS